MSKSLNPFVGLRPFQIGDSHLFFGRREQTEELLERLHRTRFLAVVGSSGCGKSSLVRAGLIPTLKAGFLVEERDAWQVSVMKPGEAPLRNLAAALPQDTTCDIECLAARLRNAGIEGMIEHLAPAFDESDRNLLLLVDQFEEVFRFGLHARDEARRDEAAEFVSMILSVAERRTLPVYVVITMRSDFICDCDAFYGLPEAMNRSHYLVPRLTRKQRRQAIEGPIRLAGGSIAPRLLDQLLNESGEESDQLPVLQHALLRTWEKWRQNGDGAIDIRHYELAGTLSCALSDHAEEAIRANDLDLTRRLFQVLTDTDGTNREIRRPARISEIEAITGAHREAIWEIIKRFYDDGRSFLYWSDEIAAGDKLIDISHESLIRRWKTLRKWVREEAESVRIYRRLAQEAADEAQGKAGLWFDREKQPQMQLTLDWWENYQPTAAWAGRHGLDFEEPKQFLYRSKAARDEREARHEAERREELERARELAQAREEMLAKAQELTQTQAKRLQQTRELARTRKEGILWLAAMLVVVVAIAAYASIQRKNSDRLKASYRLVSQAWDLINTYPQRGLLLALEALKRGEESASAENVLRRALSRSGGRGLGGHTDEITSLTVSGNHWLITGSADGTARRWVLDAPNPEADSIVLPGDSRPVVKVAVSPDSRWVITGDNEGRVRISSLGNPSSTKSFTLDAHRQAITALAISPDGHWLITSSKDGTSLWDWKQGLKPVQLPIDPRPRPINKAKISGDSRWLVANGDGDIDLWDLKAQPTPRLVESMADVSAADISPDSQWLAIGGRAGARLHYLPSEGIAPGMQPKNKDDEATSSAWLSITSVVVSPDSRWVITASENGELLLWNSKALELPDSKSIKLGWLDRRIGDLKVSPDGHWLAASSDDGFVRLWDLKDVEHKLNLAGPKNDDFSRLAILLRGHDGPVRNLAFSSDGRWLVTGGSDSSAHRWDLTSPDPATDSVVHRGHEDRLSAVIISPDLAWQVTVSENGVVQRCDLTAPVVPSALHHRHHMPSDGPRNDTVDPRGLLKISPDSRWLVTGSVDGSMKLWDLKAQQDRWLITQKNNISALDISTDGQWLVTGSKDGTAQGWQFTNQGLVAKAVFSVREEGEKAISAIAISPDRRFLMTGREDGTIRLWDLNKNPVTFRIVPSSEGDWISTIAFSLDSRWLAVGSRVDNSARVWDLTVPLLAVTVKVLDGHTSRLSALTFSPDNRWFITGSEDGTARLYDLSVLSTKKQTFAARIFGHPGPIFTVTVSPNSKWLMTAAQDGTARLWDLRTLVTEPLVMRGWEGPMVTGVFDRDSTRLITATLNGTSRVWSLEKSVLIETARFRVGRNLNHMEWIQYFPGQNYPRTFRDLPELKYLKSF